MTPDQVEGSRWAQRLKRVFGIDIETCPACGGAMRIISRIEDAEVIEKILTSLDAKADEPEALRRPSCRTPPSRGLFDFAGQAGDNYRACAVDDAARVATGQKAGIMGKSPQPSPSSGWIRAREATQRRLASRSGRRPQLLTQTSREYGPPTS